jgi:hypothetical protein
VVSRIGPKTRPNCGFGRFDFAFCGVWRTPGAPLVCSVVSAGNSVVGELKDDSFRARNDLCRLCHIALLITSGEQIFVDEPVSQFTIGLVIVSDQTAQRGVRVNEIFFRSYYSVEHGWKMQN